MNKISLRQEVYKKVVVRGRETYGMRARGRI